MKPFWMNLFLDFTREDFEPGTAHWQRLTGWQRTPPEGDEGEYVGLRPSDGEGFVWTQRLREGDDRVHVDLYVDDREAAVVEAQKRGATLIAERNVAVMRSPGGLFFCFAEGDRSGRPSASRWPDGHASIVDQVCIDIPASRWSAETAFWSEITDWGLRPSGSPEFARLNGSDGQPLQILLQRLDEPDGTVRAHVDWATSDRDAETRRHVDEGSEVVRRTDGWTVMNGPGGTYCITDRVPRG